ncbi:MAG: B12-binding domain-containing radical SAM protein [Bacteroidota bacterium]|nr:B12-binding domain-containing radical SAM protein [Bacteroidota bacterium]
MELKLPQILLVIPPFSQINTPYPSVSQLSGFLKFRGYEANSYDLSLTVALRIFSSRGLGEIFAAIRKTPATNAVVVDRALALSDKYIKIIDPVISFLQGKNPNLAYSIIKDGFLPQGEAFSQSVNDSEAFGSLGIQDKAKYYCSLLIDDLTMLIQLAITPHFGLSRYAEKIASSAPNFDVILAELNRKPNIIEKIIVEETEKAYKLHSPEIVGFTIPFPGNLLGALISARYLKENYSSVKIVFGGGYINTELRKLNDKRIFNYVDFITYDDGEFPLLNIVKNHCSEFPKKQWVRTMMLSGSKIEMKDDADEKSLDHNDLVSPSLDGIYSGDYIPMIEMLNPMHRLWSDGYWNKLSIAHGCYWRKCTFCDITLDYIKRYSPAKAATIVDSMENLIKQSGRTSFHFTDEAAPPSLLKDIALEILRRDLAVSWWGNIRFEKSFSKDICKLLSASGCVAVSGGLEVADERLLNLINKGVTLKQVTNVCHNFQESGIMVHAYLMYGFPSQTEQEIINSLEMVRQFLQLGLFQSGFWHLFSLTTHSPIAADPEKYGIKIQSSLNNSFANNDLIYEDSSAVNYKKYSDGLSKALYNYMHGIGLDWELKSWFDFKIPMPGVDKFLISKYLNDSLKDLNDQRKNDDNLRAIWIGEEVKMLNGTHVEYCTITAHSNSIVAQWKISKKIGKWIKQVSLRLKVNSGEKYLFSQLKDSFPGGEGEFYKFSSTQIWEEMRENFLLFV